ncbi:DUF4148 domain-containing protein [Collimonas sp. NPDC087041]|uniref:DUF4148 domain-containing protein n=1 Tax=Collimonas sp. NPDC087041 TaxID=3363960 RepID=UPI003815A430
MRKGLLTHDEIVIRVSSVRLKLLPTLLVSDGKHQLPVKRKARMPISGRGCRQPSIFRRNTMRILPTILAALTLSATASAFAEAPYPPEQPFTSTLSRAQVKQQVAEAQAQGVLEQSDASYPVIAAPSAPEPQRMTAQHSERKDGQESIYSGA